MTSVEEYNLNLEKNLNMLIEEYKLGEEIGGKYFSYMYSCINFTFIFYGAAFVIFQSTADPACSAEIAKVSFSVFLYLLPISTYVLGLFYAYNAVVISRQGYFMIQIEHDIIWINKQMMFPKHLHGWDTLSKKMPSGFIYAYGTMLMFFITLPVASMLYGHFFCEFPVFAVRLYADIFVYGLPIALFALYFLFMVLLVMQMFKFRRLYNAAENRVVLQYEQELDEIEGIG